MFWVVLTQSFKVYAIPKRGGNKFPCFRSGGILPCLEGGGRKKFQPLDFPIL